LPAIKGDLILKVFLVVFTVLIIIDLVGAKMEIQATDYFH
jgi:hypothetical protein